MNVPAADPVRSKRLPEIVDVDGMVECNGRFLLIVRKPWKLRDEPPDGALSEAEDHAFAMLSRAPGNCVVVAAGNGYRWLSQFERGARTPWQEGSKDRMWRLLLSWMSQCSGERTIDTNTTGGKRE